MKEALDRGAEGTRTVAGGTGRGRDAARLHQEQLEQQTKQLQQKQLELQQQYAAAQTNIQTLNQKLQSSSAEISKTREKLAVKEAEVEKQTKAAAALQLQLAQLNDQLQAVNEEKRIAAGQVALMQQQVQAEQAQNVRLAEGFKVLATNSGALTQEIRDNRALAPNTIFDDFVKNRVQTISRLPEPACSARMPARARRAKRCWSPTAPGFMRCATCRTRR